MSRNALQQNQGALQQPFFKFCAHIVEKTMRYGRRETAKRKSGRRGKAKVKTPEDESQKHHGTQSNYLHNYIIAKNVVLFMMWVHIQHVYKDSDSVCCNKAVLETVIRTFTRRCKAHVTSCRSRWGVPRRTRPTMRRKPAHKECTIKCINHTYSCNH